jgi:tRNA N6-adenosine threonylcarbamoyltransferase
MSTSNTFVPARTPGTIRILGIETSCDETAAAVVENGSRIASSVVASQIATHGKYGGIVPELASREHLRAVVPVVRRAVEEAGLDYAQLDAIAVTQGPGLVGALMVGLIYAKSLSLALAKPLVAVNHLEGHIYSVLLEERLRGRPEPEFPALSLVVSGGHTLLAVSALAKDGVLRHRLLGRTRDDAAGEAFDKVAKLLALGYPGGPVIDKISRHGDPHAVSFTKAKMKGNTLDFSFSGIKTAVLRYVESNDMAGEIAERRALLQQNPSPKSPDLLPRLSQKTLDLAASFQSAVVEELVQHTIEAANRESVNSVFLSGGVSANSLLRERFAKLGGTVPPVFFPRLGLTTDNAAMIATAAFPKFQAGQFAAWDLPADASLALEQ